MFSKPPLPCPPRGPRQAGEELLRLQALPPMCPSLLKDSLLVCLVSPLCPACAPHLGGDSVSS